MSKVKIRDKQTGQIIEVDEAELGNYGLAAPTEQPKSQSLLSKVLPILGGIGGGIAGGALTLGNPLGIIAGGAIGSGLGQAGSELTDEEKGINTGRIAKETVMGGVGGIAGLGLGKVLGLGAKVGGSLATNTAKSAVRGGVHFSPSVVEKGLKAGISLEDDLVDIAARAKLPVGTGVVDSLADQVVGSGAKRVVTKGVLNQNIDKAEEIIQGVVKTAGNNYRIPATEIKSAIREAGTMVKKELGKGELNTKSWNKIMADVEAKYAKGFTLKQGMKTSRYANEKFASGIFAEAGDATASLAQKLEAEAIRNAIKTRFPKVAEALSEQQRNIILREGITKSKAQNLAKGSRLGQINPLNPLSLVDKLINNQKSANIAAKFLGRGTTPAVEGATPAMTKAGMLGQVLGQGGSRAFGGEGTTPEAPLPQEGMSQVPEQERTVNIQGQEITESQLRQAIIDDYSTTGGKNVKALEGIYEQAFPGGDQKPLSVAGANAVSLAQSGARGLQEASFILQEDPGVLTKQLLPGKFASRKFDSAMFRTVEALLRARSGAAVPESEVRRYMEKYAPSFGDTKEVVQFKLNQLASDFEDIMSNIQGTRGGTTFEGAIAQ